jgi:flagellar basal body rod protein FlgG
LALRFRLDTLIGSIPPSFESIPRLAPFLLLHLAMDNLTIAAASGMRARMESLDLLAHNLANAGTTGFKADREIYRQSLDGEDSPVTPIVEGRWTDFSQGALVATGRDFDFALHGPGWFAIKGPNGPLYTRDGSFHLSREGKILTREGYEVEIRTPQDKPFRADPRLPLDIASNGAITQQGETLGTIRVVEFASASHQKLEGNYFSFSEPRPIDAQNTAIERGRLEQANVAPAEMAVRLVNVMRQFEMLNRAISFGAEMNRRAIEEVARVG